MYHYPIKRIDERVLERAQELYDNYVEYAEEYKEEMPTRCKIVRIYINKQLHHSVHGTSACFCLNEKMFKKIIGPEIRSVGSQNIIFFCLMNCKFVEEAIMIMKAWRINLIQPSIEYIPEEIAAKEILERCWNITDYAEKRELADRILARNEVAKIRLDKGYRERKNIEDID